MNKLPWFTHDGNAGMDEAIQKLIDKHGHFGYSGYFMIIELLHTHGKGDTLIMRSSRVASYLRSRVDSVKDLLNSLQMLGKCNWEEKGKDLRIQIPKFRERQAKMRFKNSSKIPEEFPKPSIEENIKEENIKEQKTCGIKPDTAANLRFESLWNQYPKRNGKRLLKADAMKEFKKVVPENWEFLERAIRNYSKSQMTQEGIGIKNFVRFMRNNYWKEWIEPEQKQEKKAEQSLIFDRGHVPYKRPDWQVHEGEDPAMAIGKSMPEPKGYDYD